MISLKLIQIDNAVGVAFPEAVLQRLNVMEGDTVCLVEMPEGYMLVSKDSALAGQMKTAGSIMREDRHVLKALKE